MAVVEDKNHSHDQISTTSIPMNNDYTRERDLFNKFLATENQSVRRCHAPLPTVKPVHQQRQLSVVADELDDDEDLELSLGLSMNGRFGFDPNAKKIKRTTSIPEFMIPVSGGGGGVGAASGSEGGNLIRTCSLPAESEEEWRKRKELQTQRRMEARRKRNEKQRNLRAMRERSNFGGGCSGGEGGVGSGGVNSSNNLGDGLIRTTSLASGVGGLGLNGGGDKEKDQVVSPAACGGGGSIGSSCGGGSIGSSSANSDSEGQQHGQGTAPMDTENSSKIAGPQNKPKDLRNLFEDMPSVSTIGEGPNGKRIEGFLYKYGKGEQVRILCVCHGSFLTPAEFVKHAGGGDVANPLKHIVVSSSLN
ncbi:ninja-family protein AFP3 [Trifolium repens]|nr:ninja-family protein AFP3 [Trifolium repens]